VPDRMVQRKEASIAPQEQQGHRSPAASLCACSTPMRHQPVSSCRCPCTLDTHMFSLLIKIPTAYLALVGSCVDKNHSSTFNIPSQLPRESSQTQEKCEIDSL
jgi:hypothetical protein